MNTSKQVNVMIGLLFLAFLAFGAYILNEPNRQASAADAQEELKVHRGAQLFVQNCRTCHGLVGEGGVGPPLDVEGFLLFDDRNDEGLPETPEGDVRTVRTFLFDTIACGRTNSAMPPWAEDHGGPLSNTQINYLVDLITAGHWDVVDEIGHETDEESGTDPSTVVFQDAEGLALTNENCGQYGAAAVAVRTRDPRAHAAPPGETPDGEDPGEPQEGLINGLEPAAFYQASCVSCHGADRGGVTGLGLPLTPEALTEPDDFYFETIKNGRAGTAMPPWGGVMDDEEISTMVEFLKTVEP